MADKTQVYSIGIYTVDGKSDISVFRYDPRVVHNDTGRSYRNYTPASLARVERLIEGGTVETGLKKSKIHTVRKKSFHPSPVEREQAAG